MHVKVLVPKEPLTEVFRQLQHPAVRRGGAVDDGEMNKLQAVRPQPEVCGPVNMLQ